MQRQGQPDVDAQAAQGAWQLAGDIPQPSDFDEWRRLGREEQDFQAAYHR
jgi:hypothetical protein